jgi:predicted nuclease of predicted toxin-antitoxin system
MSFLVDAQLPRRMTAWLTAAGCHAVRILDLLTSTGNISNRDLEALATPFIPGIVREFQAHSFLELGRAGTVVRG